MAAVGAADGFFRCVYEGCISSCNTGKERRPYHQHCGCDLHSKSNNHLTGLPKYRNVSYPIRRAYSEGGLALAAASCYPSSPWLSSPVVELAAPGMMIIQMGSCNEEDDDDDHNFSLK